MGPSFQYAAKVVRVIDGDTLDLLVDLGFYVKTQIRVRVASIDTPELRSESLAEREHAAEAAEYVRLMLPVGTGVIITTAKPGAYSRWDANVYFSRNSTIVSLANELFLAGYSKRPTY